MEKKSGKKQGKATDKHRLGELLVEYGLITTNQLQQGLTRQSEVGGQIGSILVEMGFITTDQLLDFLSKQLGVPSANLFKLDIDQDMLRLFPMEKIKTMKVLPIATDDNSLALAMVNPDNMMTIREVEFTLGRKVNPIVVPALQMEEATKSLLSDPDSGLTGKNPKKKADKAKITKAPQLPSLLRYLARSGSIDMLLTAGVPPAVKIHNNLKRTSMDPLTPADCETYAKELMSYKDWEAFMRKNDIDFGVTYPDIGRFRVNVCRQRNSVSITLHHFAETLPSFKELNLPGCIKEYAFMPQGLILVTGPAGHGKTTTLCTMVDIINTHRRCNIVTLEDPIEYAYKHKKSNVNQREIGRDTDSLSEGLRRVLRQSPDVIVVGELKDRESFEMALQAADAGQLVLSTVIGSNSTSIIERVINMFPPDRQKFTRMMLADCLLLSFSQRLVPLNKGQGRILAHEKLINTDRIKDMIREERTYQIRSQIQIGSKDFTSIDVSLANLYNQEKITFEDGLLHADNRQIYRQLTEQPNHNKNS
jgi:twitching motility protein PilT